MTKIILKKNNKGNLELEQGTINDLININYKPKEFYLADNAYKRMSEFVEDVKREAYNIRLQQKYVGNCNHREPTDKSLDWIIERVKSADDIRICHIYDFGNFDKERFEVVFMTTPKEGWYLAWCEIDKEKEKYFVDKYKLELHEVFKKMKNGN
jgi:hypothetical protein